MTNQTEKEPNHNQPVDKNTGESLKVTVYEILQLLESDNLEKRSEGETIVKKIGSRWYDLYKQETGKSFNNPEIEKII